MPEQDPESIEVLVRQFGKDTKIDPVLGKTQRVLPKPKLLEPVRNLLHWLHRLSGWRLAEFRTTVIETLCPIFPDVTSVRGSLDKAAEPPTSQRFVQPS